MSRLSTLFLLLLTLRLPLPPTRASEAEWPERIKSEFERIDEKQAGTIGVYLRNLSDGRSLCWNCDRPWYLSSTVKVAVAVVLLKQVEAGAISLDEMMELKRSHLVDGSGSTVAKPIGTKLKISFLLKEMLRRSDSVATDMLIERIGEEKLNSELAKLAPGFGPITKLIDVRRLAYAEAHPQAKDLTNREIIEIKRACPKRRMEALARELNISPADLKHQTLEKAFESYYAKNINSAPLAAPGALLERLARGELLSPQNTALVLEHMEKMTTGFNRVRAGLPPSVRFAQKTGTQLARVCNIGIAFVDKPEEGVVIAACVEKFSEQGLAEASLRKVGRVIATLLSGAHREFRSLRVPRRHETDHFASDAHHSFSVMFSRPYNPRACAR